MFRTKRNNADFWNEIERTQEQMEFATTLRLLQVCHEEGLTIERALKAFDAAGVFLVNNAPVPEYQTRYERVISELKQK